MKGQLSALHVSERAETLYRRLLRSTSTDVAKHAAALGWGEEETAWALDSLLASRLVRRTPDGSLVVDHPRAAIERLVEGAEGGLDSRRRELAAARAAISQFTEDHSLGRQGYGAVNPAWETLPAESAPSVGEYLVRSTTGLLRSCIQTLEAGPGLDEDAMRTGQAALAAGRPQRAIYPLSAMRDQHGRAWMRSWAGVGEQQRVLEQPPTDFAVFGSSVVLATIDWGVPTSDYVVVRDPMLVAAFTALFDQAWERALPVRTGAETTDEDRRLLALLASGFKDEAIARYLGWGLRTVRRHIARLMSDLGVDNRFQLGAAAQRQGLLAEPTLHRGRNIREPHA